MTQDKVELKAVETATQETQMEGQKPLAIEKPGLGPSPAAMVNMVKLTDGSVQFNFGGPESDVLGLIGFAKLLIIEQMRQNATKAIDAKKTTQSSPLKEALPLSS